MEVLSLKAEAVWEGIVLPWVCTWAGFSPNTRSKGLMWSSDLVLCFAEPQERCKIILQRFWEGNLCPNGAGALSSVTWSRGISPLDDPCW